MALMHSQSRAGTPRGRLLANVSLDGLNDDVLLRLTAHLRQSRQKTFVSGGNDRDFDFDSESLKTAVEHHACPRIARPAAGEDDPAWLHWSARATIGFQVVFATGAYD